mgnify:CR=1 FL=1
MGGFQNRDAFLPADGNAQEASFDLEVLVLRLDIAFFPASGVLVRGGAAGELLDAGFCIDGNILPVTVATEDVGVYLGGNELANVVSFVGESFIGVGVTFAATVRTDARGGG